MPTKFIRRASNDWLGLFGVFSLLSTLFQVHISRQLTSFTVFCTSANLFSANNCQLLWMNDLWLGTHCVRLNALNEIVTENMCRARVQSHIYQLRRPSTLLQGLDKFCFCFGYCKNTANMSLLDLFLPTFFYCSLDVIELIGFIKEVKV